MGPRPPEVLGRTQLRPCRRASRTSDLGQFVASDRFANQNAGMRAIARAVRIYGSDDSYGEPRQPIPGSPFEGAGFPERCSRCEVHFGAVPSCIREQIRDRDALAQAILSRVFGGETLSLNDAAERIAGVNAPRDYAEHNFYVTIVLDNGVELPDEALHEDARTWIDLSRLETYDRRLRSQGAQALDVVTAYLAPIVDPGIFRELVEQDRFYFLPPDGRPCVFYPNFQMGTASLSVARGAQSFPGERVRDLLAGLGRHAWQEHVALGRALTWYAKAMTTADRWRRFEATVFALEVLTNKLGESLRPALVESLRGAGTMFSLPASVVDATLWQSERMPLTARFAIVAATLSPETSEQDVEIFARVKAARDRLSHGQVFDEDELPAADAESLLQRYTDLARDDLLG